MKEALRKFFARSELPFPDEIYPRENGEIVCLWYEPKVAMVVSEDE
jgi:hypothetical protein